MMHSPESIDPLDLAAYVDNQLDAPRRIAVERWLSLHPDAAAQVMTDLQFRDELRLMAESQPVAARQPTEDLARALEGRLRRNRVLRHVRPLVAASLLVTAGWVAHGQIGGALPPEASTDLPEYVSAAVDAHHITALRANMHSQTRGTEYDPDELLAETAIRMPAFPAGWTMTDVQVYPSDFGPSVELAFDADGLGAVSLFAARPGRSLIERPATRHVEDTITAYWQIGDIAYALVAGAPSTDVSRAASSLFDSLD